MFNLSPDLPQTFSLNYSEFPNSCPDGQFALVVEIGEVLVYGRDGDLEQLGHQALR